jgi:hypothetical protein
MLPLIAVAALIVLVILVMDIDRQVVDGMLPEQFDISGIAGHGLRRSAAADMTIQAQDPVGGRHDQV